MTTDLFTQPYLTYDKYGLFEVRCMASNKPIKTRMEEPSKIDPKKFVYVIGTHPNYREFPVLLSDNTISFLMVSDEYQNTDITPEYADRISKQIHDAKKSELEYQGKTKEFINVALEKITSKRVIRRLTLDEIKTHFGGKKHAS